MENNNINYEAEAFDDLTFANDFMFCKVMTKRPDLLIELTELITGRKVKGIKELIVILFSSALMTRLQKLS